MSSSFYPAISYRGPISATWDIANGLAEKDIKVYVLLPVTNFSTKLDVKTNIFKTHWKTYLLSIIIEEIINNFSLKFILAYGQI